MAEAICNTQQHLTVTNTDGVKYFMEKLLLQIYEHFDQQDLTDVTFKLSNPYALVTAHRLILSAASPYFKELFKSDKGVCPLIEITDIDSDTFERLITFCYTGKTLITIDNVDKMLKAAIILQLDDVVSNCADFIIDHVADYTLERVYALEREAQNDLLNEKILEYETRNFMEIIQHMEFLNIEFNKLRRILESDNLNVKCEKDVFEAVKRWYEHDTGARKQELPDLISCLRLTEFDSNYITSNILTLPCCRVLALEALTWHSHPLARLDLALKYTKPRGGRREEVAVSCNSDSDNSEVVEEFLAFDKKDSLYKCDGDPRTIYKYNKLQHLWQKWGHITIDISWFGVIFVNENLIFTGGVRNFNATDEVSNWNFKSKTFQRLPSMNKPRYRHSIVILNEKIYAIGGLGKFNDNLKSVEMYSTWDGWQLVKDMITPRYISAAVTLNGKIYVMGGSNKSRLKSVESYDPTTNCWTECADMNEAHSYPGATVHNGQIFVVGGGDGRDSRSVERYDPRRNEWTNICSLDIGRCGLGCISIDNRLWAVGGSYKDCTTVYDDQNNKWINKRPMPSEGEYYCFTVPATLLQSE